MAMKRLEAKLKSAQSRTTRFWPLGIFLTISAFVTPGFRPPAASQAMATGRTVGQVILIVLGITFIVIDILRSRRR